MPISVECGACEANILAPDIAAGKRANCPKCGALLVVPAIAEPTAVGATAQAEPVVAERPKRTISAVAFAVYSLAGPAVRRTLSALVRRKPPAAMIDDESYVDAEFRRLAKTASSPNLARQTKDCPFCGEKILAVAKKCKHCGETIDVVLRAAEEARRSLEAVDSRQNGDAACAPPRVIHVNSMITNTAIAGRKAGRRFSLLAGVLSLLIPGLGQLYRGRFFPALFWFILTALGYACFIIPGVVLHILCVLSALFG